MTNPAIVTHMLNKADAPSDKKEPVVSKPAAPAPAKRQAADVPADALMRAYERARLRMAMTSEPPN